MINTNFVGFLTADPTARKVGNSTAADFRVGARTNRKDKEGNYITNFLSCTAFGPTGDYILKNAKKSMKLYICGSFADVDYTKNDGTSGHSLTVTVTDADIANPPRDSAGTQKKTPQATAMPEYDQENPF